MGEAVLEFECIIKAPLETVWAFHQNVNKSLPRVMPREMDVRVELAETPRQVGSRIVVTMRGILQKRIRTVSRFLEFVPPHPVVFGEEARFADEQVEGPFKSWRHAHEMYSRSSGTTQLLERVTYEMPLGVVGKIVDWLVIRPRLRAIFAYRQAMMKKLLDRPDRARVAAPACNSV